MIDAETVFEWLGTADAVLLALVLCWAIIAVLVYCSLEESVFPGPARVLLSVIVPTLAMIGGKGAFGVNRLVDIALPAYTSLGASLLLLLPLVIRRGARRRFLDDD